jgi:hypothetical protein
MTISNLTSAAVAGAALSMAACATNPGASSPTPTLPEGQVFLTASQISVLIKGQTAYLKVTAGGPFGPGGELPFYYAANGIATLKYPTGKVRKGTWAIAEPDQYCVIWSDVAPEKSCTRISKAADDSYSARRAADNVPLPILRFVAGNAENL